MPAFEEPSTATSDDVDVKMGDADPGSGQAQWLAPPGTGEQDSRPLLNYDKVNEILNPDRVLESREKPTPEPPVSSSTAAAAASVPKKKKGTAQVNKPKTKKGTAKKKVDGNTTKTSSNTKKKSHNGTNGKSKDGNAAAAEDSDDDMHDTSNVTNNSNNTNSSSDEPDPGPYCICRGPDDHRWMISCDRCEDWFHGECVGMDKYTGENLVQRYICPNCTDPAARLATRFKKTCALEGCVKAARIYGARELQAGGSLFCSNEHCQAWWEHLIATLPKGDPGSGGSDELTQEEFMGLLNGSGGGKDGDKPGGGRGWTLGQDPFAIAPDFWDQVDPAAVLTEEELTFLNGSAADRYNLGEEIVLCKKMLQILDLAWQRRAAAITASASNPAKLSSSDKDLCGYDSRLDAVGATAAFAAFVKSPRGDAVFRGGRLDPPRTAADCGGIGAPAAAGEAGTAVAAAAPTANGAAAAVVAGMCARKKCKPHGGWYGVLGKSVRHQIKELAALAKEKLDAEARVREGAALRYMRKMRENNWVKVYGSDSE